MRLKISLLLTLATTIASVAAARDANVFASGLTATKGNGTMFNISYTLNAPAQNVAINIYKDNVLVKSFNSTGKEKGLNSIAIDMAGLSGEYTWSVKATGQAWANGEAAKRVIDKTSHPQLSFMHPRGIAIDQDTESEYYGRIYVTETQAGEVGGRNTNVGIYVFDPTFSDITKQGNTAYSGNVDWGPTSGCTRIFLNTDQKIYLCDWSDGHPGVWRANANNLRADFVPVFGGTPYANGLRFNSDGEEIAGSIASCWVEGEGENTVLYTFDEDYVNVNSNSQGVYQYIIGNISQPWTNAPSNVIYANGSELLLNGNSVIIPQNGGWWISQTRWQDSESIPCLIYVKDNQVLYNSGAVDTEMIKRSYSSAICLFDEGTKMAVSCYNNIKVFDVTFNDAGVPSLSELYNIEPAFGEFCYSIAVDNAHNMYCSVDHSNNDATGNVGVIALPCDNICETPAPSSQTINADDTGFVPGDVNGDGVVTAADITALYDFMLNNDSSGIVNGDQNGDGHITAADITAVYGFMLSSSK